jgi:hypothetical protein
MNPSTECRKLAWLLREKAMAVEDAEIRAEFAYLIRGFLRLAGCAILQKLNLNNNRVRCIACDR